LPYRVGAVRYLSADDGRWPPTRLCGSGSLSVDSIRLATEQCRAMEDIHELLGVTGDAAAGRIDRA
jgi:hypothetical protein